MQQLGFDLPALNPTTGEPVAWRGFEAATVARIKAARWNVTDLETTGLTPYSAEQNLGRKELEGGAWGKLRARVCTVLIPAADQAYEVFAFDLDKFSMPEKRKLADAVLKGAVFGWNVGFDAFWLRDLAPTMPTYLLDGMLMARALRPDLPVLMARRCVDDNIDQDLKDWAHDMFLQERSGWSLADVSAILLDKLVNKGRQGPKNWTMPVLDQTAYEYAIGDAVTTYEILAKLLDATDGEDLLDAYFRVRACNSTLALIEPQVLDVVSLRESGMPFSQEGARVYAMGKYAEIRAYAKEMTDLEPSLLPHLEALQSPLEGIGAALKAVIGDAFAKRGLLLSYTDKSGQPQIGEKDLRKAKAALNPQTKELYRVWVGICKAKKVAQMALENAAFAARTVDSRIRALLGHGPVTGRLSASEPNVQQYPRDPLFRALVEAGLGKMMCSCDFSALDVRVGEALAIRAQREIRRAWELRLAPSPDVQTVLDFVFKAKTLAEMEAVRARTATAAAETKRDFTTLQKVEFNKRDKAFWSRWREISRRYDVRHFAEVLAIVQCKAMERGEQEWGSLRDAFNIPGMDIHSWTALAMSGQDPQQLFAGLDDAQVAKKLKEAKAELGSRRQTGKVGNLSLLYAMKAAGLMETASKNYDIHWTIEQAQEVVDAWLASYPEIDLWHCWTKFQEVERVKVPSRERGEGQLENRAVFASKTLGGRVIFAFGLNAALSYQDQSTGADILGTAMRILREDHPHIFKLLVNQIHDEILAEFPEEHAEEYGQILADVMVQSANKFLGEYGVRVEVSPAIAKAWPKD